MSSPDILVREEHREVCDQTLLLVFMVTLVAAREQWADARRRLYQAVLDYDGGFVSPFGLAPIARIEPDEPLVGRKKGEQKHEIVVVYRRTSLFDPDQWQQRLAIPQEY